MEVSFSSSFKRTFRKRIKNTTTESDFWVALEVHTDNPFYAVRDMYDICIQNGGSAK